MFCGSLACILPFAWGHVMAASAPFRFQNRMKSYALKFFGTTIRTDRLCLANIGSGFKFPVCSMTDSNQTMRFLDVTPNDSQGRFQVAVGAAGSQCMSILSCAWARARLVSRAAMPATPTISSPTLGGCFAQP